MRIAVVVACVALASAMFMSVASEQQVGARLLLATATPGAEEFPIGVPLDCADVADCTYTLFSREVLERDVDGDELLVLESFRMDFPESTDFEATHRGQSTFYLESGQLCFYNSEEVGSSVVIDVKRSSVFDSDAAEPAPSTPAPLDPAGADALDACTEIWKALFGLGSDDASPINYRYCEQSCALAGGEGVVLNPRDRVSFFGESVEWSYVSLDMRASIVFVNHQPLTDEATCRGGCG